jgi:hypothetical protein
MLPACRYAATNRYLDEQMKHFQRLVVHSPVAISLKFEIQHNVEIIWPYLQKRSKKYILDVIYNSNCPYKA